MRELPYAGGSLFCIIMKNNKGLKKIIFSLGIISVIIYALQLIIFRDPKNTFFYIFQDFAFMPISIAIATFLIGELVDQHVKEERIEKTRMLTSTFYTNLGVYLIEAMLKAADEKEQLGRELALQCDSDEEVRAAQERIQKMDIHIHLDKACYDRVTDILNQSSTAMLVLASSPVLLEHESFTDMLWGIFHLMDERRIRGEYENLDADDISHLEEDYGRVLNKLISEAVANAVYLQKVYPDFYSKAREKVLNKKIQKQG